MTSFAEIFTNPTIYANGDTKDILSALFGKGHFGPGQKPRHVNEACISIAKICANVSPGLANANLCTSPARHYMQGNRTPQDEEDAMLAYKVIVDWKVRVQQIQKACC